MTIKTAGFSGLLCVLSVAALGAGTHHVAPQDGGQQDAVAKLLTLLKNGNAAERQKSVKLLGTHVAQAERVIPALEAALKDKDATTRSTAAHALGGMGDVALASLPKITKLFTDKTETKSGMPVWYETAIAVSKYGKSAVPGLIKQLDAEQVYPCRAAAIACHEIGPDAAEAVPALVKAFAADEQEVNDELLYAVIGIGPAAKPTVPAVVEVLRGTEQPPHLRMHTHVWACRALASVGVDAAEAIPDLIKRTSHEEGSGNVASVRKNAVIALAAMGERVGKPGIDAYIHALDDYVVVVREPAMMALGALGETAEAAAPELKQRIEEREITPAALANVAYWQISGDIEFVKPRLLKLYDDFNGALDVAKFMQAMGPDGAFALDKTIESMGSSDPLLRLYAVQLLEAIGNRDEPVVNALRKRLTDGDLDVREATVKAMKTLKIEPEKGDG